MRKKAESTLHWWGRYFKQDSVIRGLERFVLTAWLFQILFIPFIHITSAIVFAVATLSFLYAVYHSGRKIYRFVGTELYPEEELTGFAVIGLGGILFGALSLYANVQSMSVLLTVSLTYAYAIPVWAYFEVIRESNRKERNYDKIER